MTSPVRVLLVSALLSSRVVAQSGDGVVTGRVVDRTTQAALPNATISIGDSVRAVSDADGRFALRRVPPGIVQLDVRLLGYRPVRSGDLAVSAGKPVVLTIALDRLNLQLEQVVVRPSAFIPAGAPATPVSATTVSGEELRRTPGALEDPVQALSVTPGIATTGGGRNDLFVRGGASFENLFVVDNLEVPNINHFGTQGATGGPLSLINVRFIENVTLSAGGFGARYGDRVSSVTSINLREGNRERVAGEVNVSATQFGAIAEGPMGKDASFLFNVRRSYLDLLFKALGVAFVPTYTDATGKVTWRPSRQNEFSLLAVGALDGISYDNSTAENRLDNSRILGTSQDQYFAGATFKRLFASGVLSTTAGRNWSRYRSAQYDSASPPTPVFRANSTEGENSARTDLTLQAGPRWQFDIGAGVKHAGDLRYDILLPGALRTDSVGAAKPLSLDSSFSLTRWSAYVQANTGVTSRLTVTAGVRMDGNNFLAAGRLFSPRASAAVALTPATTVTMSVGRYVQAPQAIWLAGDPGNGNRLGYLKADQVVVGLQQVFADDWRWQVEGFAKRYTGFPGRIFRPGAVLQPSGFDDVTQDIPFGLEPLDGSANGEVTGFEALLQKRLGTLPFYGLAAVTANRARFTALNGADVRSAFETPLIVNVVGGWRPNARWEVSGRMRASTGLPYTPFVTVGANAGALDFTRANAERLPTFFSVDARVDRRWVVRGTQLVTFVDVGNVNAHSNVTGYRWNRRSGQVEAQENLVILPTIGVNWEF